jgi:ParB-like chromosome segregation protein Spo0J
MGKPATAKAHLRVEIIPIAKILPYVNNPKRHPDEQVAQIAASIREFGFNDPIAIDKAGTIIAGHGRYLAAKLLQMKTVPVIKLPHLSPAQRKAYRIAHNKISINSNFDLELLTAEFELLRELKFDVSFTGFDEAEIEELLKAADFEPAGEEGHGQLDQKAEVTCPECGHKFIPH